MKKPWHKTKDATPLTVAERKTMSRPYRRLRGRRPLGLSSNVHAKKAPASLYRNPADYPQDGLNHAGRKRQAFLDWWQARRRDAGLA